VNVFHSDRKEADLGKSRVIVGEKAGPKSSRKLPSGKKRRKKASTTHLKTRKLSSEGRRQRRDAKAWLR